MNNKEMLVTKYSHYEYLRHAIFAITLSTYVKSEKYARSTRFESMWNNHVIYKIRDKLPYKAKAKIDHNYVIELSVEGFYHYHGLVAVPAAYGKYIYQNGCLNKNLERDLRSFRRVGIYRYFRINTHEIKPCYDSINWIDYITKESGYIPGYS